MTGPKPRQALLIILLAAVLLAPTSLRAQTSQTPYTGFTAGVSCSPNGELSYNGNSFVVCSGGVWVVEPVTIGAGGTCSSSIYGQLQWTGSAVQVCTSSGWSSIAASGITGSGTTNYLARWTPNGTTLGIGATYDNGTNVGIGTASVSSLLQTYDSAAKTAAYTGVLHDVFDTSSTASVNKVGMDIESTGVWTGTSAINTGLVVNATGGTTNYAATFSGGNVGIGTTVPTTTLQIGAVNTGTSVSIYGPSAGGGSTAFVIYDKNGNNKFDVLDNGKTGIGGIGSPGSTLSIDGNAVIGANYSGAAGPTNGLAVQGAIGIGTNTLSSSNALEVNGAATIGYPDTYGGSAGGLIVAGNVGIGTTSPAYSLDVRSASSTGNQIHVSSGNDQGGYIGAPGSRDLFLSGGSSYTSSWTAKGTQSAIITNTVGTINFFTDSGLTAGNGFTPTQRMIIGATGLVGIGTTSPQNPLDVNGAASIGYNVAAPTNGLIVAGSVGIGTSSPNASAVLDLSANTTSMLLPVGTAGQQPTCNTALQGAVRYDTTIADAEYCNGSAWTPFKASGPQSGAGNFVITKTTYGGNFGGISSANADCLTELTTNTGWWGYAQANANGRLISSKVFAFLCDGTTCNNLQANTTYYFGNAADSTAGGSSLTTNGSGLGPNDSAEWQSGGWFGGNNSNHVWTGRGNNTNTQWPNSSSSNNCTAWTTNSSGVSGGFGIPGSTTSSRWFGTDTCNVLINLICFVNP